MATGAEVLTHFGYAMERTLLASGRVQYFPLTEIDTSGDAVSRLHGVRRRVIARKRLVDATFSRTAIPTRTSRRYTVVAGIDCVPVRDLPTMERSYDHFCVIGSGKTGVDSCLWLLENGVEPDRIRWIMPRSAWWFNRAQQQYTNATFETSLGFIITQMEALARANSATDVFRALEERGYAYRGVPGELPTMDHATTVSPPEVGLLHGIKDVIRAGRLSAIGADELTFHAARVPTKPNTLYVDCSANGITVQSGVPIFAPGRITLQIVRILRPSLSAAMLGLIEATMPDDNVAKNELALPVSIPRMPEDLLRMMATSATNSAAWNKVPHLAAWLRTTRLDPVASLIADVAPTNTARLAIVERLKSATSAGLARLPTLLAKLGPQVLPPSDT